MLKYSNYIQLGGNPSNSYQEYAAGIILEELEVMIKQKHLLVTLLRFHVDRQQHCVKQTPIIHHSQTYNHSSEATDLMQWDLAKESQACVAKNVAQL